MCKGRNRRKCILYLTSESLECQLEVACFRLIVTSIEVAMSLDATAIDHSCVAMNRLVIVREAGTIHCNASRARVILMLVQTGSSHP